MLLRDSITFIGFMIEYTFHGTTILTGSGTLAHCSKGRDKDRVSQFLLSEHVPFLSLSSLAVQISVTRGIGDEGMSMRGLEMQRLVQFIPQSPSICD